MIFTARNFVFIFGIVNLCTCHPESSDEESLRQTETPQTQGKRMQPLKLHYSFYSFQSRAVIVMLKQLDVSYDLRRVDVSTGEQKNLEYLKMNPQGALPILDDNGFFVSGSHNINAYLNDVYGETDKFYPKDRKARSIVNQLLYFDAAVLANAYRRISVLREGKVIGIMKSLTEDIIEDFERAYEVIEGFLKNRTFIAGNEATIADISVYMSLSVIRLLRPPNPEKYPHLLAYVERCETDIQYLVRTTEPAIKNVKGSLVDHGFQS